MRTLNTVFAAAIVTLLASVSFAGSSYCTVDYFSFAGFDAATVRAGGQVFPGLGVNSDVDVTVTTNENSSGFSLLTGAGNGWINFGHDTPGSDSVVLEFSRPVRVSVKTRTVDDQEIIKVFSSASESYCHISGPEPVVTTGSDIEIMGTDNGSPAAVASGEIWTDVEVNKITVTHEALENMKFDAIMIGEVTCIPEPNAIALLGIGALGLAMGRRKRRN